MVAPRMVPPRWVIPRTSAGPSGITPLNESSPSYPRWIPYDRQPRPWAERTTARMTAFKPGASPPPVEMAMRMSARPPDQLHDLPRLRVAPQGLLGEHQVAVHGHLEDPARRRNQPDVGVGHFALQLSRQTGGSGLVVSDDAVLDDHPHAGLLWLGGEGRRES